MLAEDLYEEKGQDPERGDESNPENPEILAKKAGFSGFRSNLSIETSDDSINNFKLMPPDLVVNLGDMLGVCSQFFKQLQETCDKFKTGSNHTDGGSGGTQAKKPKKKMYDPLKEDPNAPKKPIIQAYLLYYTDVRAQRQIDHPKLQNKDITKIIADEWNKLPKDKKEPYEIKARVNRGQYEKDLQEYLKKNPSMKEALERAKEVNKRTPTSGDHVAEAPAKPKATKKVLGSSSDEEDDNDDAQMKSPSPEKKLKTETKGGAKKKSESSDSDSSDDSDDDSDSD